MKILLSDFEFTDDEKRAVNFEDVLIEHIAQLLRERNDARDWARRMKRERDEARKLARHFRWWSLRLGQIADIWSKKWYADFDKRKAVDHD